VIGDSKGHIKITFKY